MSSNAAPGRAGVWLVALLACAACVTVRARSSPPTGMERAAFQRPSTPEEVVDFLRGLAGRSSRARTEVIGYSAGGRPIVVLFVRTRGEGGASGEVHSGHPGDDAFRVLLIGSQHGTEPSGGEALQVLARGLVQGPTSNEWGDVAFALLPDANPDGRALRRRVNGNGVNLSTNFVTASEPETRAILGLLARFQPHAVLDVHESAILKKKSLGAQGYLTDFETQIEYANNPNVDPRLSALSQEVLGDAVTQVLSHGIPAQRYLGEITDVRQPITHGGLSVKNLRNMAGMMGAVSLLIENRLDPAGPEYPTPRNLKGRADKQLVGVLALLDAVAHRRREIGDAVGQSRVGWRSGGDRPVYLLARYGPNPKEREIVVPLRRWSDGVLEALVFERHDLVERDDPILPPAAYLVTAHVEGIAKILDRHGIAYRRLSGGSPVRVTALRLEAATPVAGRHGWGHVDYSLAPRCKSIVVPAGALWIELRQPAGRLLPLLLEPRSNSGIFQDPAYGDLLVVGEDAFLYRVASEDAAAPPRR